MREAVRPVLWKSAVPAALIGLALLAGGCSSVSNLIGSSSPSSADTQASASASPPAPGTPAAANAGIRDASDFECPQTTVRTGAATLTIGAKGEGGEVSPMALKFQGTIGDIARECRFGAGIVTMKVGIEGRIISGPAATDAAQFEVPLRIAVVHEGPQPKTVVSKLARVPVSIPAGSNGVTFTHIDPEVAFPMPQPPGDIDSYVVYVGFDPQGIPPEKKARPKTATRPRR